MKNQCLALALAAVGLLFGGAQQTHAEALVALTTSNQLITFDSNTPGTTSAPVPISGLVAGDVITGIDRRLNGIIYAFAVNSSNGFARIYTVDSTSGAASLVSTLAADPADNVPPFPFQTVSGTSFGVDFNPTVDRLRVVSHTGQNLRLNVANGLTMLDVSLSFQSSDQNFGQNPLVTSAAYTNNFLGATSTTLYGLDSALDILVTQDPANSGLLNTVGGLGVNFGANTGFDISGLSGIAYAVLQPGGTGFSMLYSINLTTGQATLIGQVGSGFTLSGLATQVGGPAPVPEPTTMLLLGTGLAAVAARARKRHKS